MEQIGGQTEPGSELGSSEELCPSLRSIVVGIAAQASEGSQSPGEQGCLGWGSA